MERQDSSGRDLGRVGTTLRWLWILAAAIVLSSLPAPAEAQNAKGRWLVRGVGVSVEPASGEIRVSLPTEAPLPEERTALGLSDGSGFGLGLEYRLSRKISFEAGALFGDFDANFRLDSDAASLADRETMGFEIFILGASYHLTAGKRVDLHAGVFAAMSFFDDVIFLTESGRFEKRTFDDDYGIGVKLGLDVPFRRASPWTLITEVRYLSTILEGEIDGQDLDLDPLIVSVGVGYRF